MKISQVKKELKMSGYIQALRPWSFTASITPVAVGACLAYRSQGVFSIYIFLATLLTVLCVHTAGNLVNTYLDFIKGVDNKRSDDRTLVDNILSPANVLALTVLFYVTACAGFMILTLLSPARVEHLVLIFFCGLCCSYVYTGGLGIKYIAMGDILIMLAFGPLTVMFSYLSQAGHLSLIPAIYAIPHALNCAAILHGNNTRDVDSDRQAGIVTLAILLGPTGSYWFFFFSLFAPYLIYLIVGINYCPWMLLPAGSIFLAFSLESNFRRRNLKSMPQKVAELNLIMGILYVIAIFLVQPSSLPYL